MAKSNTAVYKCMLQQVPTGEGSSSGKVHDVIELVTDMGLLIKHSDGCFTINPKAKRNTETIRKVKGVNSSRSVGKDKDLKKDNGRGRKRRKRARKEGESRSLRPWMVESRTSRTKRVRRGRPRGSRRGRSLTRTGARKRQRKPVHKTLKFRSSIHKKKTLRRFYSVMKRLTESLTDMSKKIKRMV